MINTKLATLLYTLSEKEIKQLKKWIASPFFNKRKDVIELFDFFCQYQKKYQSTPSKESIFEHLFPNQNYDDHKVRLSMSFLKKLTEQFLVYQVNQEDTYQQKMLLSKVYRERKLESQAKQLLRDIEKYLTQNSEQKGADHYELSYQYHTEKLEYEKTEDRTLPKSLQKLMKDLDTSYLIRKLMYATRAKTIQNYSDIQYDLGLLKYIIPQLKESENLLSNPVVYGFYKAFRVSSPQAVKADYLELKQLLLDREVEQYSLQELDYLLAIAIGYSTIEANKGNFSILIDLLDFYKFGLEKGLFGDMNHHTFKNIVNIGLSNRKLDWVDSFIQKYGERIDDKHRVHMVNMSKANLAYFRGEYHEALELIRQTSFNDIFHKINTRIIVLKSLYNLKEWSVLQSQVKAFEVFIRRHVEIGYKQELYLNFILILRRILNLNPYDETAKTELQQQLKEQVNIGQKKWLLTILED